MVSSYLGQRFTGGKLVGRYEDLEHILAAEVCHGAVGAGHNGCGRDGVFGADGAVNHRAVRPEVLQACIGAVKGNPLDDLANGFLHVGIFVGEQPGAAPEVTNRRGGNGPIRRRCYQSGRP